MTHSGQDPLVREYRPIHRKKYRFSNEEDRE
jgi:hypothetical protein